LDATSILTAAGSMAGIGGALSLVLYGASRKFHVHEDPRIDEVQDLLSGANCGACGFAGCRAYAEAVVKDPGVGVTCPVGGDEATQQIAALLGVEMSAGDRQVARLLCNGTHANAVRVAAYAGVTDCRAAALIEGLERACPYGCLGLGSCVTACAFDAMRVEDGLVVIDEDACTSCGACVKVCPQHVLRLQALSRPILVSCSSTDKGATAKKACKVACIGCKRCVKACDDDAITVKSFLASIDPDKCTACRKCVGECPTGSILDLHRNEGGADGSA
jgi:Na+-translocating ferredoxin:NAD+ oxidoreductase subunit B